MSKYESIFICPIDVSESALEEIITKLKDVIVHAGGEVIAVDKWGRKKLAYRIAGNYDGYYTRLEFSGPPALPAALTQTYKVNEKILRHLTIKIEIKKTPVKSRTKTAQPQVQKQAAAN